MEHFFYGAAATFGVALVGVILAPPIYKFVNWYFKLWKT